MKSNKNEDKKTIEKFVKLTERNFLKFYPIFHIIIAMYAVAVSIKCEQGVKPVSIFLALACPHFFLLFTAATKGLGFCFLSDDSE